MDAAVVERYISTHPSSLKLMIGANSPEEGDAVTSTHVANAIGLLTKLFRIVIVDTPASFTEAVIAAIEASDKILMLCTLELATLRDVSVSRRIISEVIKIPLDRMVWVMNATYAFKALPLEQFVENLEQSMDFDIPYGGDIPAKAATSGSPFIASQPGSAVAKAVDRIARMLEADAFPQQATQERRGLFNRR